MIRLNNISKKFNLCEQDIFALKDISMDIQKGSFTCILGPSGSGKSTLLSIIAGLMSPTTGTASIDNIDITHLSKKQLAIFRREYIGFIFQSFHLIPHLTVLENVMLPMIPLHVPVKTKITRAEYLLKRFNILQQAQKYPSQLSGGEQQRVAIVRALINNPPIILADEPTGNLDSSTGLIVMDVLKKINKEGKTIIMVTHNKDYLRYFDMIITLKDGKKVSQTPSLVQSDL
ncbi:MAG: ABC transporter ATP-binding protein [Calditrichia bacterium]